MNIGIIFIKVTCILLGILFLKSSISKLKKPYQFYLALESYSLFRRKKALKIILPFFLSLEIILSIGLLYPFDLQMILIAGMFLQFVYLLIMVMDINKNFSDNCGCFALNVPKEVSIKNVLTNLLILFIFVVLFGIEKRI